ncbi:MAG: hypothetical protein DRJ67_10270 [Thermoprotei archaeon]|nr:MAG: hypothetical protein DRJ67_10270 [Thermoprotei archaeon]
MNVVKCDYCGEEIEGLPYKCKYCGGIFCVKHHLPENHNCPGLHEAKSPYVIEREERMARGVAGRPAPRPLLRPTPVFHPGELRDLAIGMAAAFIALAYPWALRPGGVLAPLLAVLLAVLPHELAHKLVAQRMGFTARFTLSGTGLLLTLLSAIPYVPFKIIMPGYVAISAYYPDRRSLGLVALSGPLVNIVLCLALLPLPPSPLKWAVFYASSIIALINLIPLGELDGAKVLRWSWPAWGAAIATSIALYALAAL